MTYCSRPSNEDVPDRLPCFRDPLTSRQTHGHSDRHGNASACAQARSLSRPSHGPSRAADVRRCPTLPRC
ncbi:unnamed protein product [Lota lota]